MRSIIRAFVFGGLAIGSTSLCSYGVDVNGAPEKPAAPAKWQEREAARRGE